MTESSGIRWAEHVAHIGEDRNVYMFLVGKSEKKITIYKT